MKIILSRKGIDSGNVDIASPILPDGTLLSIPIPTDDNTGMSYADIQYQEKSFEDILRSLNRGRDLKLAYHNIHLDPDIRKNIYVKLPDGWFPAFGTRSADEAAVRPMTIAQPGDIFLFFGRFRHVDEGFRFSSPELHCIWGYMQVGQVITDRKDIEQYHWHPHSKSKRLLNERYNTLYIPSPFLSWDPLIPGCGTLKFHEECQLTLPGKTRALWRKQPFYMPEKVTNAKRKNSDQTGLGLYYSGFWQELVLEEDELATEWAKTVILSCGAGQ